MTRMPNILYDKSGATIAEFALILPCFALLLMGAMDLGYQGYAQAVTQGVVQRAARSASVGGVTSTNTDNFITTELNDRLVKNVTVSISKMSYQNFSSVSVAEKIVTDTNPTGSYNTGDCYLDTNDNDQWDSDMGTSGLGGAEDVVFYDVTVSFSRVFPMAGLIGWPETQTVHAQAAVKNQPYDSQTSPIAVCQV
jgi:Flp pilus assembly protein TadG